MAKLGIQQVDVADIGEMVDFGSPLPAGNYTLMVTESELKQTKKKDGNILVLKQEVQDGEHQGRAIFTQLNIENPNAKTVEIAFKELGALCRAIGLDKTPDDSEKLHNKRYTAVVVVDPAKPYDDVDPETGAVVKREGKPRNRISKYLPLGSAAPAAAASTAKAPAAKTEATKGKTPPWKKS